MVADKGYLHRRSDDFAKVPEELMHDLTLTDGAVRLYAHMHWRYGSNCSNHEGRASMGKYLGVSETAISQRVALLVQQDWIAVQPRFDDNGRTTNEYHVFELQADCQKWRLENNEPKPESAKKIERKSRSGKGGKPSHNGSEETQVNEPEPKPEFINLLNSGSHDPETSYPETIATPPDGVLEIAAPKKPKPKSTPQTQPQADLLDGWIEAVGKDKLPAGFAYGPYMRFTKALASEGYQRADLICAGALYRAWIDAHPGKFTPDWQPSTVIPEIRRALQLCKDNVGTDDAARFVKARLSETDKNGKRFWAGKLVSFEHVAANIGMWLAEHPKPTPQTGPRTWFDDVTGIWFREVAGARQRRDPATAEWLECVS